MLGCDQTTEQSNLPQFWANDQFTAAMRRGLPGPRAATAAYSSRHWAEEKAPAEAGPSLISEETSQEGTMQFMPHTRWWLNGGGAAWAPPTRNSAWTGCARRWRTPLANSAPGGRGFRMTAHRDDACGTGAVVRKPPGKERAGSLVRGLGALWRFDRGEEGWGSACGGSNQEVAPHVGAANPGRSSRSPRHRLARLFLRLRHRRRLLEDFHLAIDGSDTPRSDHCNPASGLRAICSGDCWLNMERVASGVFITGLDSSSLLPGTGNS